MTGPNTRFADLALCVVLCLANPAAWALDPSQPPGGNFDLSHWKLQLPTRSNVLTCSSGSVDEETPAEMEAGFTNSYFYTGPDGAMVFWVPLNGSRTSGSSYPRSELRERIDPGSDSVNWIPQGIHILDGQCKVLQVGPSNKKTIIGQIHGYLPSDLPLVKFQYGNGSLTALIKTNSTYDGDYKLNFGSTGLGSNIVYQIKVVNGLISITVNGSNNSINVFQTDPRWSTNTMYFKAGNYCQESNCSNPSNYGARVSFSVVNVSHAPSITNQPVSQVVTVGSNVTFSVGALGNPPLKYFWQFNGAPMSGQTNATLSIPNVQLTNAGNYSVIVTDYVGTVTSVVTSSNATLTVNPLGPTASFTATPTNGVAPLQVVFADTSTGPPTSWTWDFGDAGTSTLQNPSHTYTTAGVYTVNLMASNAGGSNTNTKTAYINVITPLQSWSDYYGVPGDSADADGDGLSNTNEFLAGFKPTDDAAYLHIISVAKSGNDMDITYLGANGDNTWSPGVAERTNVLEYSAGTVDGGYTNNFTSAGQTNILNGGNGSGVVTNMMDPGGATNLPSRFYRVRLVP